MAILQYFTQHGPVGVRSLLQAWSALFLTDVDPGGRDWAEEIARA